MNKKKLVVLGVTGLLMFFAGISCAGFNMGIVSSVKKKVEKLKKKADTGGSTAPVTPPSSNTAPVLTWTGEADYSTDGVNPETADTSASYVYRVKYADADGDAPALGYPKVHILKGGSEISGSPFAMNHVSGAYNTGAVYTYTAIISTAGTDYTYYFEAQDDNGAVATGAPTTAKDSPDVIALPIISNILPDTGQTKCYNNSGSEIVCPGANGALAQDGSYQPAGAQPGYTDIGDMVVDNRTGLIWAKDGNGAGCNYGNSASWPSAVDYCWNLTFGGHDDWRLPDKNELESIVNNGGNSPVLNTAYFPNAKSADYWTSTTDEGQADSAWLVDFKYDGSMGFSAKSDNTKYIRCVRSQSTVLPNTGQTQSYRTGDDYENQTPARLRSYTSHVDGTVTDNRTGLMWAADGNGEGCNSGSTVPFWEDALSFCENSTFASYTDWRLPNKRELNTLVDSGKTDTAINISYFPNTKYHYWTSTTYYHPSKDYAPVVHFYYGYVSGDFKFSSYHVRCVRGGL